MSSFPLSRPFLHDPLPPLLSLWPCFDSDPLPPSFDCSTLLLPSNVVVASPMISFAAVATHSRQRFLLVFFFAAFVPCSLPSSSSAAPSLSCAVFSVVSSCSVPSSCLAPSYMIVCRCCPCYSPPLLPHAAPPCFLPVLVFYKAPQHFSPELLPPLHPCVVPPPSSLRCCPSSPVAVSPFQVCCS